MVTADEGSARKQQGRISCSAPASEPLPSVLSAWEGKKRTKRILKRESPVQGWFLQLLKAVLHRNIYPLHPTYRVQNTSCNLVSVGWGAMLDTEGQKFSHKEIKMSCCERQNHSLDCPCLRQCTAPIPLTACFVAILLTLHVLYIFSAIV